LEGCFYTAKTLSGHGRTTRINRKQELLIGGLFLPDGLPEAVQLNRSGVSHLSKPAQGGVATVGTFNYFAGNDPTGIVFIAASWK
jgi:hypothetical protein